METKNPSYNISYSRMPVFYVIFCVVWTGAEYSPAPEFEPRSAVRIASRRTDWAIVADNIDVVNKI